MVIPVIREDLAPYYSADASVSEVSSMLREFIQPAAVMVLLTAVTIGLSGCAHESYPHSSYNGYRYGYPYSHYFGGRHDGNYRSGKHYPAKHDSGKHYSVKHRSGKHHSGRHHTGKHHSGRHYSGRHRPGKHYSRGHHSGRQH